MLLADPNMPRPATSTKRAFGPQLAEVSLPSFACSLARCWQDLGKMIQGYLIEGKDRKKQHFVKINPNYA